MNNKKYIFTGLLVVLAIAVFLFITGVIEGEYAILQSYPEDKYVGGEGREPGDTKCDLNIRSTGTNMAELIQQWQTNPETTIVSEDEFILQSGLTGQRFVIDSMGGKPLRSSQSLTRGLSPSPVLAISRRWMRLQSPSKPVSKSLHRKQAF